MRVLGKTIGTNEGRWYWSIRHEYGIPESIGQYVWGIKWENRDDAIAAYREAERKVAAKTDS